VERPERGAHPGRAGNLPARTNDIDLDERRKTLTGAARWRRGGKKLRAPGASIGFTSPQ